MFAVGVLRDMLEKKPIHARRTSAVLARSHDAAMHACAAMCCGGIGGAAEASERASGMVIRPARGESSLGHAAT